MHSERRVDVDEKRPGAHRRTAGPDADAVEPRDVEDDPGRGRVAAVAVPAGARHDVDVVAPTPADRVHDVADGRAEDDRLGPDRVEARAVEQAGPVVARARAREDVADEPAPELTQVARRGGEAGSREDGACGEAADEQLAAVERLHGPTLAAELTTPMCRPVVSDGHAGQAVAS